jgi:hypothetical protein
MGTESVSRWQIGRGVAFELPPYLATRLKKEYSYTSYHPVGHHSLLYGKICPYKELKTAFVQN